MRIPTALRRKEWLYLLIVMLLIGASFLLDEEKLTIAITRGVEGAVLKTVAQDFATDSGISVEVVEYDYDRLYESSIEQLKAPTSRFDVILLDDPWLPALAPRIEQQAGLQRLIFSKEECEDLRIEDFVKACIYVCRADYSTKEITCPDSETSPEHLYALPFVGNSQLFARHDNRMHKTPSTWDEVFAPSNRSSYVLRVGDGNRIVTDFIPLLWAAAPNDFTPTETPHLSEDALKAFGWLDELAKSSQAKRGIASYDDFDLAVYMAHGEASAGIVWSAWAMAFARLNDHKDSLDRIKFDVVGTPTLGSWLLSIPANLSESQKRQAKNFILFALKADRMIKEARQGSPPVRWSVLEDPELDKFFPSFEAQRKSLKEAKPRPRTPQWRDVEKKLGQQLFDLYEQRIEAKTAWQNARNALQDLKALTNR